MAADGARAGLPADGSEAGVGDAEASTCGCVCAGAPPLIICLQCARFGADREKFLDGDDADEAAVEADDARGAVPGVSSVVMAMVIPWQVCGVQMAHFAARLRRAAASFSFLISLISPVRFCRGGFGLSRHDHGDVLAVAADDAEVGVWSFKT